MNVEYALIRLLLEKPHDVVELNRKGFKAAYVKNVQLKKVYKKILDCQTRFQSVPTDEDLTALKFTKDDDVVPYTLDHCVSDIIDAHNKSFGKELLLEAAKVLTTENPKEIREVLAKSLAHFVDLERQNRSINITDLNEEIL